MTKEQEEKYLKIVATGRYSEEQLRKIRNGFERPAKKIDREKAELAWDVQWKLEALVETINGIYGQDAAYLELPSDDPKAYNVLLTLEIPGTFFTADAEKETLTYAINAADNILIKSEGGKIYITFGFMYVWDSEENVNRVKAN